MIRSTFSRSRVLAFFSSVALVACGAIAACSGFSSEDASGDSDSGGAASDSSTLTENDGASDAGASTDASDGSVLQVPLYTFCEAGLNDGSSPHYACLDFEHGDGTGPGWSYQFPTGGSLTTTTEYAATGVRAARVPKNTYQLKVTPGSLGGTWSIAAKVYLEGADARRTIGIVLPPSNSVSLSVTGGSGSVFGSSGNVRAGIITIPTGKWVDVLVRITATPNLSEGGYVVSPQVAVADASITIVPFSSVPLSDVLLGFGDFGYDGGIVFDDVVVDVVQ